ncbi:MAG: hypothetical protein AAF447_19270 [Myxococcota bacterium]
MTGRARFGIAWVALAAAAACGDGAVAPSPTEAGVAPGSGALVVRAQDAAGLPVVGAEVSIDGELAGLTDASGRVEVGIAAPVVDVSVASGGNRVTWLGVAGRDVRVPFPSPEQVPATSRDVTFASEPAPDGVRRELRVGFAGPLVARASLAVSAVRDVRCDASTGPCTVRLELPAGVTQVFGLVVDVLEGAETPVAIGHADLDALDDAAGSVTLTPVPTVRRAVSLPAPLAELPFESTGVIGVPGLGLGQERVWVVPLAARNGDEVLLPALEGAFTAGRHWLFARQEGAGGAVAETRVLADDEGTLAPPDFLPPPRALTGADGLRWDVEPGVLVEAVAEAEALLWLDAARAVEATGPLSVAAYELPFAPDSLRLDTRVDALRRTVVTWSAALRR